MNQNNGMGGGQFTNNGSGAVSKENISFLKKLKNLNTKKNISILMSLIVLIAVVLFLYKSFSKENKDFDVHTPYPNMVSVEGKVRDVFEGTNDLNYVFNIPDIATTTKVSEDGYLIKVIDGDEKQASIYFSYQGSKSLTPEDYISYVVAPHVPVIETKETQTIGNYDWQLAETQGSNWYVTTLNDGMWIVAIESKKTWEDQANALVESFKLK